MEKADDIKARILLEKMEADDAKTNAQQEMMALAKKQESCQKDFKQQLDMVQVCPPFYTMTGFWEEGNNNAYLITFKDEIKKLSKCKQDILEKLKRSKAELEAQRAETSKLKQRFKVRMKTAISVRFN